ncbi:MAG: aldehyde dehydrogenase family protein [Proteobacteria bacterium]|nr:aldehyde dehydrogenase family protein [Pseudomonadota bacterium]HQR02723.1 aldehyde dehydrogenase family protein [Rhodocyclaceae bacterium]
MADAQLYIDGQLRAATDHRRYDVINPATGAIAGQAPDAGAADMDQAIAAARRAFDTTAWSTDRDLRIHCLSQLAQALQAASEEWRPLIMAETGCPIGLTYGPQCDIPVGGMNFHIDLLHHYAFERELPVTAAMGVPSKRLVWKEAAGVVGAISPWNMPVQINLAKLMPALAAGCTAVLKAAPETPWSATFIGRIAAEKTDLPPGVLNIITSGDRVTLGEQLVTDPRVDMVSFTGSTATGRRVMELASRTVKKIFLELGGKSATILLDDADFDQVLPGAMVVCYHAGQGCSIPTRLLIPRSRYAESVEKLKVYFEHLPFGNPNDPGQIMGPLISRRQQQRVLDYIRRGVAEGARLVAGNVEPPPGPGFYVRPTLFADVRNDMTIAREEIFGPVLCVIPFDDDEDAIRIANDSIYGLSGAVFSASTERAMNVARRIRTGTFNINGANYFAPDSPFGGYKQSGIGREMGIEGFEEYLQTKTVAVPA